MLTQNIRENGQIFGKNKIWQRNKLLSLDVRTDLGDLGLTQSICPQSEKKNPWKSGFENVILDRSRDWTFRWWDRAVIAV